jgi:hypothetical protein
VEKIRELVFYRHYFEEFFERQTEQVKNKEKWQKANKKQPHWIVTWIAGMGNEVLKSGPNSRLKQKRL